VENRDGAGTPLETIYQGRHEIFDVASQVTSDRAI
jgi:hypothetical protein